MKLRNGTHQHLGKALLDSGSEINILSKRCYNQLKLRGESVTISIVGVGGVVTRKFTKKVKLIVTENSGKETEIECVVLDEACGKVNPMEKEILDRFKGYDLVSDNPTNQEEEIDILIGMSSPQFHKRRIVEGESNGLTLIETPFGYCVVGPVPRGTSVNYMDGIIRSNHVSLESDDIKEGDLLKFVEAEMAGILKECPCSTRSDDELKFDKIMETSWKKGEDGRLEVRLPWKIDPNSLENNRTQAISRDIKIRTQLSKRPEVMQLFEEQINEMIAQGVLFKVDAQYPRRYLPLLAIVNLDRESTKVRVCLDAKSKYKGISLNDALLKGRLQMNDILQVLSRFRAGKNALLGDIKKMFWQIRLSPDDVKFHGIVWKGETFVFSRVCFGDKNSPPIADQSMKLIAYEGRQSHPHASEVLMDKRYMDDIIDANQSEIEVRYTKDETDQLLGQFGFQIKEWFSNNPKLGTVCNSKVLGMKWCAEEDKLSLVMSDVDKNAERCTKRTVLSKIASIWDPLGLCAGFIVRGRLIFQSIVRLKTGWDEKIEDGDLVVKWERWRSQIADCKDVVVGRNLFPHKPMKSCSMIGFSDGSSVGYGSVIYLRWCNEDESEIDVRFVAAKGKVGPINGNTVPRMELCGSLLLSRLANSAKEAFEKSEIGDLIDNIILCTDSLTVKSWINSEAIKYRPYVKNKIIEIQDLHPVKIWRYIPTYKNKAADLISKGCDTKELDLIIEGPDILRTPVKNWPTAPKQATKCDGDEKELIVSVNSVANKNDLLDLSRYNDWQRLLRVTAYVMRIFNGRSTKEEVHLEVRNPNHEEIRAAKTYWVREAQKQLDEVPAKQIEKLTPFKDEEGVIRISGRLKNSNIFDNERVHPKLLPTNHPISKLIVRDVHEKTYHPGHLRVMFECRKEYWIIGLRCLAKSIGKECVICRWWRGLPLEQLMSDLPSFRITPGSPFENTAVDYFGPFQIRFGRNQRTKAYGAIFTCLTTRSIHLELVTDLTTDRFLMALRRFISLYGQPKFMRSDNGKNFIGAAAELKKMINQWRTNQQDKKALVDFCAKYSIKWTFSTPLASHHNGAVESMIKSVKNALNKVIKTNVLTEEEYRTVLSEITSCINSRPLWPSCEGDLEQPPITCNDLLRPGGLERNPVTMDLSDDFKKRYQYIQRVVDEWWALWMRYFVPNLQTRTKWFKKRENLAVGDIVLVVNPQVQRAHWKMARVQEVFPGKDGHIRSAEIKSNDGSYIRPISKLVLLLSENEYK